MPSAMELALRPIKSVYVPVRERIAKAVFVPGADLQTKGVIDLEQFGLAAPERSRYKPVGWSVLPRILPAREVSSNDVLVDLRIRHGPNRLRGGRAVPVCSCDRARAVQGA
jgi:hypothetical protein